MMSNLEHCLEILRLAADANYLYAEAQGGNIVRVNVHTHETRDIQPRLGPEDLKRYTKLPVGWAPAEIDFADYRDVSGIKIPFRITKTWVDGRSVMELTSIEVNASIPAAKFARPTAPLASNK